MQNGTLTDRTTAANVGEPWDLLALAVADMDGDKDVDYLIHPSSIVVFLNDDGKGVLGRSGLLLSNVAVQNPNPGRHRQDGYPDVLLTCQTGWRSPNPAECRGWAKALGGLPDLSAQASQQVLVVC